MESLVVASEKHYTPNEIAELWHLDPKSVRKLFAGETGVLRFGNARSTGRKRAYMTVRIPQSVLDRVHRKLQSR